MVDQIDPRRAHLKCEAFGKEEVGDLFRNAARAVDLFNLPPRNFLVIGRRIEI